MGGCEDPDDWDCDLCESDKPGSADLKIRLTINNEHSRVPLTVYYDKLGGHEFFSGSITSEDFDIPDAPLRQYYVAEATYLVGNDTIFVIDGDFMDLKEGSCEDQCWIAKGDVLDVTLKYD